jgi:UDP-N-acetylmuramate: L-alanyl-gamma-D-glutamyl-meso-diaminopimelate ligase
LKISPAINIGLFKLKKYIDCFFILNDVIQAMKIHLIAVGGSAMHNMALALHKKGYQVTGSDDEINEPSKSRLAAAGLLPTAIGWFPERIQPDLDAVILGMHARQDNPELLRAKDLNLKIYSYPEYIYEQSKSKTRVVIGGSHGKTTITSMVLHALKCAGINSDYLVGAQLKGFDTMVQFSEEAKISVIEGDEYLSSPIDRRPKFHLYQPSIGLISGIAWDHVNVFPTFENYVEQFRIFIELIASGGTLIYCNEDPVLKELAESTQCKGKKIGYSVPDHVIENGKTILLHEGEKFPLKIFGKHNLLNLAGASLVCRELGVEPKDFFNFSTTFEGAAKRLELVLEKNEFSFFKDFAHSPSKLKATITAVKNQFPDRLLVAAVELHTFSSLNETFLKEYHESMKEADIAIVYFNPHTIAHKKLKPITEDQVKSAFGNPSELVVMTESAQVSDFLISQKWKGKNLLMMSSGNFDGIDFHSLGEKLIIA